MIEKYFISDLARPFYEIVGEKALIIIYNTIEDAKKKYKIIEAFEKKGFDSKIIFKKNASQSEKNAVLSFLAKKCYEKFNKQVGTVAKPMINFILSNYKEINLLI